MATTRALKEAFYAGHSGGSIWEAQAVILHSVAAYALYCSVARRLPAGVARVPLEALVLAAPLLAAVTLAAAAPAPLAAAVVAAAAASVAAPARRPRLEAAATSATSKTSKPTTTTRRRPFSVVFRAVLQLLTVVSILAVDFRVFPRRFAKTETFGYSLMDLGVGGFIFSNGFVAGPRLRTHQSSIAKSVAISLPILLLGFARLVSTRSVEYHEHVSEYGVHWNFFVTLGLIPVLTAILQSIVPKMHFGLMGAVIMAIYEYVLTQRGLQAYIFDAKREGNFFQLNREGICSFFGYWAIFFVAAHVGERILTTPEQLSMKEAPILAAYNRKKKSGNASDSDETTSHDVADQKASNEFSIDLVNIIDLISILTALLTLFAFVRYELHHQVSRRVANMSYCLWVICVSLSLVLGTLLVDYLFTQWFNPDESSLLEAVVITEAESSSTTKSRSKSKSTTRGSRSISKNQDLQQRRKRSKSHSRGISQARGRSRSKQVPLDGADDQETKVSEQHRIKLEAVKEYIHRLRTPLIFDCINRNQLAVFLLANILTGLVNLSIDTLSVPSHVAMGILVAYLAVVIAAAVWWNEMGWNLNLNSFVIGGGSSAKKRSKVDKVE